MDAIAKLTAYTAVALLLIAANIWFARIFIEAFFKERTPDRIPPFQIVGKADTDGKLAAAMPHMLHSRLERISHEMKDALEALQQSPAQARPGLGDPDLAQLASREIVPQIVTQPDFILLTGTEFDVFDPPNLNMSVGGVEVGGFIAWVHRQLVQHRLLQISINYTGQSGKQKPIVYGNVGGGGTSLYLGKDEFESEQPSEDEVIDMIAYAMMQQRYREQLPVLSAFKTAGFRKLMLTLSGVADLNRRIVYGRTPNLEEYESLAQALRESVEVVSTWRPLVHLAAALAENARNYEDAKLLYARELELLEPEDENRQALVDKIRQLDGVLVAAKSQTTGAGSDLVGGPLVARIHGLLGVHSLDMPARPTIAVLGDPPTKGLLAEDSIQVINGWPETDGANAAHFDSVVRAVRLVAPDARFVFRARHRVDDCRLG